MSEDRIICWFSCGAASAVATKKTLESGSQNVEIVYCDTMATEHPDNARFFKECEAWFGKAITRLHSRAYKDVDDVFEKTRYMSGVRGARCTTEMKKVPRHEFAHPHDIHVFGFTADEKRRIVDFETRNPELQLRWILRDIGVTKQDCYRLLGEAGINLPAMYKLGFDNNNCLGCVKASSPWYWSMVRKHFPDVFERRCVQSRQLGVRLVEIRHHDRIFLDELPQREFPKRGRKENLSCGPECGGPAK